MLKVILYYNGIIGMMTAGAPLQWDFAGHVISTYVFYSPRTNYSIILSGLNNYNWKIYMYSPGASWEAVSGCKTCPSNVNSLTDNEGVEGGWNSFLIYGSMVSD